MTTPHKTALHEFYYEFRNRLIARGWERAISEDLLEVPFLTLFELETFAAEFAPLLAAIAGGQYVSPGSGMVVVPAELLNIVRELRITIAPTYDMSQEGRAYLARIDKAMLAVQRSPATTGEESK